MTITDLTPDEIRALLRECVTVIKPGETLIVRLPASTPIESISAFRESAQAAREAFGLTFPIVVMAADEIAIAEP